MSASERQTRNPCYVIYVYPFECDSFVKTKTWIINKQEHNDSNDVSACLIFKVAMNYRYGLPTNDNSAKKVWFLLNPKKKTQDSDSQNMKLSGHFYF